MLAIVFRRERKEEFREEFSLSSSQGGSQCHLEFISSDTSY
jgi:hypothetical protein